MTPSGYAINQGLQIPVVAAVGYGQTEIAAFDAALHHAGIHDYNLIILSSVIPPASEIVTVRRFCAPSDEFGHRLYVVKADARSSTPDTVVAAGIGWFQWGDNRGLFVEHETAVFGASCEEVETALAGQITTSLRDFAVTSGIEIDERHFNHRIVTTRVADRPACAVVLAVYQSEGWR
jgi:arginine decarboxylase